MKITKFNHACMFIEEAGKRLVIDPTDLAELPADVSTIEVVIITHVHADHLGKNNIKKIIKSNPQVILLANSETMQELADVDCQKITVDKDCKIRAASFDLDIKLGDHAVIYEKVPCQNLRVVINSQLYYPGDSLVPHGEQVKAIAVPLSAPWCKVSEVIEFIESSQADVFFPVHDYILSPLGKEFYNNWLAKSPSLVEGQYRIINPGQSLEI